MTSDFLQDEIGKLLDCLFVLQSLYQKKELEYADYDTAWKTIYSRIKLLKKLDEKAVIKESIRETINKLDRDWGTNANSNQKFDF